MTWENSNHRDPVYDVLNMSIWTEARRPAVLEDTVDAVTLVGMSWSPGRGGPNGGLLLMSVNVSDEVGLAAELMSSQASTRSVLEFAPDAMVILDDAGQIRLANAAAERLFGYSREELAGRPVDVLIPERYRDRHSGQSSGGA